MYSKIIFITCSFRVCGSGGVGMKAARVPEMGKGRVLIGWPKIIVFEIYYKILALINYPFMCLLPGFKIPLNLSSSFNFVVGPSGTVGGWGTFLPPDISVTS